MKSKIRRELAWICLPLILLIGVGAWVSHDQNVQNAEQRRRESGPLRVRVSGIFATPMRVEDQRDGYNYGIQIIGHIEGVSSKLPPEKIWALRVKSARVGDGKTFKKVRVVNDVSPVDGDNPTLTDVWAVVEPTVKSPKVMTWVKCDSALAHPILDLELEAVEGTITPKTGKGWIKRLIASGSLTAIVREKIPLRAWNQSDGKVNAIKSEY